MNEQEILLKQTFHEELLGLYKRIVKELKYKSPRLLEMMNKYGGYEAVIKILPTDAHTFDFTLLWEQERLDLSIEALVTKERYKTLFPPDVIQFCQKRLDEYNYAPKKLKEEDPQLDDFINDLFNFDTLVQAEEPAPRAPSIPKSDTDILERKVSQEEWEELFVTPSIFTSKNQDMIIKMYGLGGKHVTPGEIGAQEGYTTKYPFYEVIMTLAKRIKSALKLEVPVNEMGKPVWWQILFIGIYHNNQDFSWSLRDELIQALHHLMEIGTIEKVERPIKEDETIQEVETVIPVAEAQVEELPSTVSKPEIKEAPIAEDVSMEVSKPKVEETSLASPEPVLEEVAIAATETAIPAPLEIVDQVLDETAIKENTTWAALKTECLDYYGPVCDLCGFDFGYTYGEAFENFIKVHVIKPYSDETLQTLDPHKDLVPICCNCDAVIHSKIPAYSIDEVKEMLAKAQKDVD